MKSLLDGTNLSTEERAPSGWWSELAGSAPTPDAITGAARAAAGEDVAPIDDVRSTADYRREVVFRLLRSLLAELLLP